MVKYTEHNILYFNHFEGRIQWHFVHSHCFATITSIQFQNILITPRGHPAPVISPFPFPSPSAWQTLICCSLSPGICLFWTSPISRITQYQICFH